MRSTRERRLLQSIIDAAEELQKRSNTELKYVQLTIMSAEDKLWSAAGLLVAIHDAKT